MKYSFFLPVFFFFFSLAVNGQVPDKFTYQLVVRDDAGKVVKNDTVSVEVSILRDNATGQSQYTEIHTAKTTVSGLVSLVIGNGTVLSGDLSTIEWESWPYFLKVRTDTEGGSNYGSATTIEIVSVPYALYSTRSDTALRAVHADTLAVSVSKEGDTLFLGTAGQFVIIPGLSEANASSGCLDANTEVVEVTSTTGREWMDRNLGAIQTATSINDSMAFGSLYQWGRAADGHQCRESDTTKTKASTAVTSPDALWYGKFIVSTDWMSTSDTMLWQGLQGINNPCPAGFRVPTIGEWEAELNSWGSTPTAQNAYDSPLKLSVAGERLNTSGKYFGVGLAGQYWSSTVSGANSRSLSLNNVLSTAGLTNGVARGGGYSVRCIKHVFPPVTGCELDTTAVVEVTSADGRVWMDRNLGAYRAATTTDDTLAYGALYQWGRAADGHQCRESDTTSVLAGTSGSSAGEDWEGKFVLSSENPSDWLSTSDDNLWQGLDGINNPCPAGFRLPTEAEWHTERSSWSQNNSTGAFASPLKLTVSGERNNLSGDGLNNGNEGSYWSSGSSFGSDARFLNISSNISGVYSKGRAHGLSVRCIKHVFPPVTGCELDATAIVEVTSADGRVWMDRNLGAYRAATSSNDTLGYGAWYQWGRKADGHQCRNSDTTSVLAGTSGSSDGEAWEGKFILSPENPFDWLSTSDDNLWQGVDAVNNPCPTDFRLPTEAEWTAEQSSWSQSNSTGAFSSPLKLPVSGERDSLSGAGLNNGNKGSYWSGSASGSDARVLNFSNSIAGVSSNGRARGFSVRCIKHVYPPVTGCELDATAVVEVTSADGRVWMDRNLGAMRAATSKNDSLAYGALYQWWRIADGHQCRNSDTTSTLASSTASSSGDPWYGKFIVSPTSPHDWQSTQDAKLNFWNGASENNPCSSGFRLPTTAEWNAEASSWSQLNSTGAFESPLKLPLAGIRNFNTGSITSAGTEGWYWESELSRGRYFDQSFAANAPRNRAHGASVRCIKKLPSE